MDEKKDEWIWWKHGIVYHIYPLSFKDSDNDGKGDLKGIIQKLDYIKDLGVDAIWLSPIFKSPMADFGYDVSDYYSIDPVFGNMHDFKELLLKAHSRNIKVILDIVLNHTSVEHQWFVESRSSKNNPKRDWYLWKTATGIKKPNNWKTAFGGSSWKYDRITKEYYLHSFLKEQPDLNWRNLEVREEMFKVMRYWLDMGVDGFRFDAINYIVKDKYFRNNPFFYWLFSSSKIRNRNQPKTIIILRNIRKLLDEYTNTASIGEIYALPPGDPELSASYILNEKHYLHLTFDFSIIFKRWNARRFYLAIEKWQTSVPEEGWPSNVFSNHDLLRSINRFGIGKNQKEKARLLAMLLMTLRGTPFIYYGEEIGMENKKISRKKIKDPLGKIYWPLFNGRDCARTPMQWNNSDFVGFSEVEPWLPINNKYHEVNVESQIIEPDSLLNLYKMLINLRKMNPALNRGLWMPISKGADGILSYYRVIESERFHIILNFTSHERAYLHHFDSNDKIVFSTYPNNDGSLNSNNFILAPFEAVIVKQCFSA